MISCSTRRGWPWRSSGYRCLAYERWDWFALTPSVFLVVLGRHNWTGIILNGYIQKRKPSQGTRLNGLASRHRPSRSIPVGGEGKASLAEHIIPEGYTRRVRRGQRQRWDRRDSFPLSHHFWQCALIRERRRAAPPERSVGGSRCLP
jgi:hypothetical protein